MASVGHRACSRVGGSDPTQQCQPASVRRQPELFTEAVLTKALKTKSTSARNNTSHLLRTHYGKMSSYDFTAEGNLTGVKAERRLTEEISVSFFPSSNPCPFLFASHLSLLCFF